MQHDCIIEKEFDEYAWVEQYLIRCKCHMGDRWATWRPTDPPFVCPTDASRDTNTCEPTQNV